MERLALLFEELGPLERLGGQPGQGGKEAAFGVSGLVLAHVAKDQDPEGPGVAGQRFGDHRHGVIDHGWGRVQLTGDVIVEVGLVIAPADAHPSFDTNRRAHGAQCRTRKGVVEGHVANGEDHGMTAGRQATERVTLRPRRDPAHRRLGTEGCESGLHGGPDHLSGRGRGRQGRAEFLEVLGPPEVGELGDGEAGPLDCLGGCAGHREQEAAVGLRDRPRSDPVDHDDPDGTVGDD